MRAKDLFKQLGVTETMSDELAETDGIKPGVLLCQEGKEKELRLKSRWIHCFDMKGVFTEDVAKRFKFATGVPPICNRSIFHICLEELARCPVVIRRLHRIIIVPIYSRRKQSKLRSANQWFSDRHVEKLRPMFQLPMEKSSPVQRVSDWAATRKQRVGKLSLVSG